MKELLNIKGKPYSKRSMDQFKFAAFLIKEMVDGYLPEVKTWILEDAKRQGKVWRDKGDSL